MTSSLDPRTEQDALDSADFYRRMAETVNPAYAQLAILHKAEAEKLSQLNNSQPMEGKER